MTHAAWTDRQRYFATMMGHTMHGLKPEWADQMAAQITAEQDSVQAAEATKPVLASTEQDAPTPAVVRWLVNGDWVTDAQNLPPPQNTVLADIQRAVAWLLPAPQTNTTFVFGQAPADMVNADECVSLPSLVDLSVTPYLREQAWALLLAHANKQSSHSN